MTLVCESHHLLTIPRRYHGEIELLMKRFATDLAAQEVLTRQITVASNC